MSTENLKYKVTQRLSYGWTDPRSIFGNAFALSDWEGLLFQSVQWSGGYQAPETSDLVHQSWGMLKGIEVMYGEKK